MPDVFFVFFIHASDFNYFLNFSSDGAYVVEEMSLLSQTAAALGFGVSKTSIECTLRAPRQGDSDLGGTPLQSWVYLYLSVSSLYASACPCFLCISG